MSPKFHNAKHLSFPTQTNLSSAGRPHTLLKGLGGQSTNLFFQKLAYSRAMAAGCRWCDGILCSENQNSQDDCYCDSKKDGMKEEVAVLKKDDMEEEVAFLREWSFVPGELTSPLSATGDYVTLFCNSDGSQFFAHSLILVNRSEVFRKMLEEVDLREKETRKVVIQEVGGESLKTFLKFLYIAQVSSEEMHANYRELVKLSHFYQVKLLLAKLDKFISSEIVKQNNCVEMLKMAYLYHLETTKEAALNLIVRDLNDELYDIAFEELQPDHPWMARDLSKSIYKRLRTNGCGKNKTAVSCGKTVPGKTRKQLL